MEHNTLAGKGNKVQLRDMLGSPGEHRQSLVHGRTLITVGLALLVLFGALTALVLLLPPLAMDVPITKELQELNYGPFGWLMEAVSAPGFAPWSFIFPLAIVGNLLILRRFLEAGFLLLATVATGSASLVKALVQRPRPTADLVNVVHHLDSYSFPSGHVTEYTLVFGFCFYLAFTLMKPSILRTLLLLLLVAIIVLVAPSRIWLGQHWASDVLGGYTIGFGLLALVIWAYRSVQARLAKQNSQD